MNLCRVSKKMTYKTICYYDNNMGSNHTKQDNNKTEKEVWRKHFGYKDVRECPLCKNIQMFNVRNKRNWGVAQIRYQYGNIQENLLPICSKCYRKYNKRKNINLIEISRGNHDRAIIY